MERQFVTIFGNALKTGGDQLQLLLRGRRIARWMTWNWE
jgi:hypothetical protein